MHATTTRSPPRGGPVPRPPSPASGGRGLPWPRSPRVCSDLPGANTPVGQRKNGPLRSVTGLTGLRLRRSVNVGPWVSPPPRRPGVRSAPRPSPPDGTQTAPHPPDPHIRVRRSRYSPWSSRSEGRLRSCAPRARKTMGPSDGRSVRRSLAIRPLFGRSRTSRTCSRALGHNLSCGPVPAGYAPWRASRRRLAYDQGCRCPVCVEEWNNRRRGLCRRRAAAVALPTDPKHGTISTYRNHGCRCDAC